MKQLGIHYFQHVPFESLGVIEAWAIENAHKVTGTNFKLGEIIPDIDDIDWLVIMGGTMSAKDEDKFPWLKEEKAFIKRAIDKNKIVTGFCLGAQLIANVLGSEIIINKHKEIGWFNVTKTVDGNSDPAIGLIPDMHKAFHWHSETFDLPEGVVHLLESEACRNQVFKYGENVYGFQCHFEMDVSSMELLIDKAGSELVKSEYVQTKKEIEAEFDLADRNNLLLFDMLDVIAGKGI